MISSFPKLKSKVWKYRLFGVPVKCIEMSIGVFIFSKTGIKAAISLGLIRDSVICKENRVWS